MMLCFISLFLCFTMLYTILLLVIDKNIKNGSIFFIAIAIYSLVAGCMLTSGSACSIRLVPNDIYKNMGIIHDDQLVYIVIKGQSNNGIYFVNAEKDIKSANFYKIKENKFIPYEFKNKETE
jgi:hypothetical protein